MAHNEDELIRAAMSALGRRKSRRKAAAVRNNGKLGGRPLGSKDKKPRRKAKDSIIYDAQEFSTDIS